MKLEKEQRTLETSGNFATTKFSIAASSQAFDILSRRLYKDAVKAILRELSTNAYDSQVEAGNANKPFYVQLPGFLKPEFIIRDFGTGLPPFQVATKVFGDWTKTECKHTNCGPYHKAEADGHTFSVKTCKDCGAQIAVTLESTYTTYFDSTRNDSNDFTGALGLGSKSPFAYTDEFVVDSFYDGYMYTYNVVKLEDGSPAAMLVSSLKTTEPNGLRIKIPTKAQDESRFKDWATRIYRFFPVQPDCHGLILGSYKPDESGEGWELHHSVYDSGGLDRINVVMGNVCYRVESDKLNVQLTSRTALVLYANIGDCSVVASREELEYTESTIKYLQRRIYEVEKYIRQNIKKSIGTAKTLVEEIAAHEKYIGIIELPASARTIPLVREGAYLCKRLDLSYRKERLSIGMDRYNPTVRPTSGSIYLFVENDLDTQDIPQKHKTNLRHFLSGQVYSQAFLVTIEDEKIFKKTFGEPAIKLSAIPKAPRKTRSVNGKSIPHTFIKKLVSPHATRQSDLWASATEDDVSTTKAVAVVRNGHMIHFKGGDRRPYDVYLYLSHFGIENVYGLPQAHYEKLRKRLGLESAENFLKKEIDKKLKACDTYYWSRWHHGNPSMPPAFMSKIKGLSPECNNYVSVFEAEVPSNTLKSLLMEFGIKVPDAPDYEQIFFTKYPLLMGLRPHVEVKHVIDYIKAMEKS